MGLTHPALMGELPLTEQLQDGWKPSIQEEKNVNTEHSAGRPVAATDNVQVQAVRVLLKEDRCWSCVEISRKLGIAVSTAHTILRKKLNIYLFVHID